MGRDEKAPTIAMGVYYSNVVGNKTQVNETVRLESYLIASALMTWVETIQDFYVRLIDYIKVSFTGDGRGNRVTVNFRFTLTPSKNQPIHMEIGWNKSEGTFESLYCDRSCSYRSKEEVVQGIKLIIIACLISKAEESRKHGQWLDKLAKTIS